MFKILKWNESLDLTEFYRHADSQGFKNNASQKMLVDCFRNENEKQVWILYHNDFAVGSVAAHTFEEMGENSYRVAVRTCVLSDLLPEFVKTDKGILHINGLRTVNQIVTHQNVTSQFLIPACLDWVPKNSRLYITSNENDAGTQKLVHRIFAPAMEKTGQMKRIKDLFYRGTFQTVWEIFPEKFYEELKKYPRWS